MVLDWTELPIIQVFVKIKASGRVSGTFVLTSISSSVENPAVCPYRILRYFDTSKKM